MPPVTPIIVKVRLWFQGNIHILMAALIDLPLWPFTLALAAGSPRLWSDDRRGRLTAAEAEAIQQ